jgi:hypothetical protein
MKTGKKPTDEIAEKALTCDAGENFVDSPLEVTWVAAPLML